MLKMEAPKLEGAGGIISPRSGLPNTIMGHQTEGQARPGGGGAWYSGKNQFLRSSFGSADLPEGSE